MKAKEKAKELVDRYYNLMPMTQDCESGCMSCVDKCGNLIGLSKQCALIAVDKYLEDIKTQRESVEDLTANTLLILQYNRWQNVKNEIELL